MRPCRKLLIVARKRHKALIVFLRPEGIDDASGDDAVRSLVNAIIIGTITLPYLSVSYVYYGIWDIAAAVMATAVILFFFPLIYKFTGRIQLAREMSLAAIFALLWYCAVSLQTVASPSALWFVGMPVAGVILGSIWSGIFWLVASALTYVAIYVLYGDPSDPVPIRQMNLTSLYTSNQVCLLATLFLFILIMEMSRRQAYKRLETTAETLHNLAIRDPLTGAFNRRYIYDSLQRREDERVAGQQDDWILLIDIDRFKSVNDDFGHDVGDVALKTVSNAISALVAKGDCFGRYGGEEFIFVAAMKPGRDALSLAEDIRSTVACAFFESGGGSKRVTVSIGVAELSPNERYGAAVKRADTALYRAKAEGRNCVRQAGGSDSGTLLDSRRSDAA